MVIEEKLLKKKNATETYIVSHETKYEERLMAFT